MKCANFSFYVSELSSLVSGNETFDDLAIMIRSAFWGPKIRLLAKYHISINIFYSNIGYANNVSPINLPITHLSESSFTY
ncbi:Protein of unknown function [Gryllus bimaculatus]|nr:Protein of unknown function [Gryllus bimaculatus]